MNIKGLTALATVAILAVCIITVTPTSEGDVTEQTTIEYNQFIDAVKKSGYSYDGEGIIVKWSPTSACTYDNPHPCIFGDDENKTADGNNPQRIQNGNAQYGLFAEATNVSITNVTFIFDYQSSGTFKLCQQARDMDHTGTYSYSDVHNAELQFLNTESLIITGCSFNGVIVSPFKCYTSTDISNCEFRNVYNAYTIKDIYSSTASIVGCEFDNYSGGIYFEGNKPKTSYTIKDNSFTNMDQNAPKDKVGTRGLIQLSGNGDYSETTFTITGNESDGSAAILRLLNNTVESSIVSKEANPDLAGPLLTSYVALLSDVYYDSLAEAINKANVGDTILLVNNTTETITVDGNAVITIDLNGHTITNNIKNADGTSAIGHTITNNGNLTIKDSSDNHMGTIDNISHGKAALFNSNTGTVTIEGGSYTRSMENSTSPNDHGNNSYYNIQNNGTMTIMDANVTQSGHYSSLIANGYDDGSKGSNDPVLKIYNGTFSGGINTVKNDERGMLFIYGGSFFNSTQSTILNWNEATISGGEFSTETSCGVISNGVYNQYSSGKLTIEDGSFTGVVGIQKIDNDYGFGSISISGGRFNTPNVFKIGNETSPDISVSGGTFSANFDSTYMKDGFVLVQNGESYGAVEGFTVTFVIDSSTTTINVASGSTVIAPELPEKEGYTYYWDGGDVTEPITDDKTFTCKRSIDIRSWIQLSDEDTLVANYFTVLENVTITYEWTLPNGEKPTDSTIALTTAGTYTLVVTATLDSDKGTDVASIVYRLPEISEGEELPEFDLEHDNDNTSVNAGDHDTVIITSSGDHRDVDISVRFKDVTVEIAGNVGSGNLAIEAKPLSESDVKDLVDLMAPDAVAAESAVGVDVSVDSKVTGYQMIIKIPVTLADDKYVGSAVAYFTDADGNYILVTSRVVFNDATEKSEVWVYTDHNTPYTVIPLTYSDVPVTEADPNAQPDPEPDYPSYPGWEDEDEYYPIIIPSKPAVTEEEKNDTTTIVACAAAAAVATLMAVFLIVDRRRN